MTPDPLGYGEALPLEERFFPLGFPLVLRTNSGDVVEAAQGSWGEFEKAFETAAIELRIVVRGDEEAPARTLPDGPVFRGQGHLLALVLGTENFAVCDLERGFGFGVLSPGVARNRLFTSFHFLDAMAYLCLCHRDLAPVHGACVARNGEGILLVGGPGAGKSSLAWACARAGLTFVSDDATYLLRREPVLIGRPQRMRFRPEALALLPDLAAMPRVETVIGKHSFEVRTAEVPDLTTAARCRPAKVVFLARQAGGPAECRPVHAEEARRRLGEATTLYESRVWKEQEAARARLVREGALELRYSRLDDAVRRILELA